MAPYVDAWFGTISACSSTRCAPAPCVQQVAGTGPSNHSPVLGRMLPPPSNAARYGEGPEGVSFVFPSGKWGLLPRQMQGQIAAGTSTAKSPSSRPRLAESWRMAACLRVCPKPSTSTPPSRGKG